MRGVTMTDEIVLYNTPAPRPMNLSLCPTIFMEL
jgi:hypothetical protein